MLTFISWLGQIIDFSNSFFFLSIRCCWALKVLQDSYVAPPALVQLQLIDTQRSSNGEDSNSMFVERPLTLDWEHLYIPINGWIWNLLGSQQKHRQCTHAILTYIPETNSKKPLKIGRKLTPISEAKDPNSQPTAIFRGGSLLDSGINTYCFTILLVLCFFRNPLWGPHMIHLVWTNKFNHSVFHLCYQKPRRGNADLF